jgi:glycosyltransferase involved in cell wall biosynthesis
MHQNKIKIVWICHFTNSEVQNKLPLWRGINEFAPWVTNLAKGFENNKDIELHIVSPHEYLKRSKNLNIRNIHYHFIPFGIPFWHRHWPGIFKLVIYPNYYFFRRKVKKTIKQIKPDLINLIGAENAYYSSSILDFKKDYPILITIQGFISQLKGEIMLHLDLKKRMDVEEQILRTFKYYGGEQDSSTYISSYNSNHVFFRFYFPANEVLALKTKDNGKLYDCIYFGRLSKEKGVEDFVKIIAEIKSKKPEIKACIVGGGNMNPLFTIAKELNCSNNIDFKGFVITQKELYEIVKASKVFLAPPYFERLSSTIREAMFLKVPVVAYATGGIPYINEFDENIYLVKTGDYQEMARRTILLLENKSLRNDLAEKAYQYAIREFSLKINSERIFSAYQTILNENKVNL